MATESAHVRLFCMLLLTFGFFIVEVVVSRMTASLSMLSDSFHMLSDVIALVVALIAVQLAEKTQATNKNTFGWIRAEVMGALVNAVFLTALCFTIVLEAIERFTEAHEIESPELVAGVGAVGLVVNLLGLCLFHEHAGLPRRYHSHRNKKGKEKCHLTRAGAGDTNGFLEIHNSPRNVRQRNEVSRAEVQITAGPQCLDMDHDHGSSSQLNMRGVFLHMLGDVLGSVIVVVNAIIFTFVWQPCEEGEVCVNPCGSSRPADLGGNATLADLHEEPRAAAAKMAGPCWVLYLDPTLCLIMVSILLYTTFPLLKESALILLQTVPKQINIHRLIERLLCLEGVLAIHELHIWQLAGSRIIATAHIKCQDPTSYMEVAKRIKDLFHDEGIHATTVQPEFVTFWPESQDSLCELSCQTQCAQKLCCGSTGKPNALSERKASNDRKASDASANDGPEAEAPPSRREELSL